MWFQEEGERCLRVRWSGGREGQAHRPPASGAMRPWTLCWAGGCAARAKQQYLPSVCVTLLSFPDDSLLRLHLAQRCGSSAPCPVSLHSQCLLSSVGMYVTAAQQVFAGAPASVSALACCYLRACSREAESRWCCSLGWAGFAGVCLVPTSSTACGGWCGCTPVSPRSGQASATHQQPHTCCTAHRCTWLYDPLALGGCLQHLEQLLGGGCCCCLAAGVFSLLPGRGSPLARCCSHSTVQQSVTIALPLLPSGWVCTRLCGAWCSLQGVSSMSPMDMSRLVVEQLNSWQPVSWCRGCRQTVVMSAACTVLGGCIHMCVSCTVHGTRLQLLLKRGGVGTLAACVRVLLACSASGMGIAAVLSEPCSPAPVPALGVAMQCVHLLSSACGAQQPEVGTSSCLLSGEILQCIQNALVAPAHAQHS